MPHPPHMSCRPQTLGSPVLTVQREAGRDARRPVQTQAQEMKGRVPVAANPLLLKARRPQGLALPGPRRVRESHLAARLPAPREEKLRLLPTVSFCSLLFCFSLKPSECPLGLNSRASGA